MINIKFLLDDFLSSSEAKPFLIEGNIDTFRCFTTSGASNSDISKLKDLNIKNKTIITKSDKLIKFSKKHFNGPKTANGKTIKQTFIDFIVNSGSFYICPYCGISPLIKRDSKDGTKNVYNFELDHFFPKESFSCYALSLYNLIPVCKSCNQTIKSNDIPLGRVFHPYFGIINIDKINSTKYEVSIIDNGDLVDYIDYNFIDKKWKNISPSKDLGTHIDYFKLNEIYNTSISSYNDIKFAKSVYDKIKYYNLSKGSITEEVVQDFFENWTYDKNKEVLVHSNGKFRKEIIKNIYKFLK